MAQFVRINQTFINLDTIRTVIVDPNTAHVTVTWSAGDFDTYVDEQATNLIAALEYLKQLSLAVPTPPDEPV